MQHATTRQPRTAGLATALATTALATTALTGLGFLSPAVAVGDPVTSHERGVVLECTGTRHGLDAYVTLYENDLHGNVVQVVLDEDPQRAGHRTPADILSAGGVRTSVRIGEHRAWIRGTARKVPVAQRTPVHEEMDDAGQHLVVDGFHRELIDDLVLRYDGTRVPLTCEPTFAYRLTITKTDVTGG